MAFEIGYNLATAVESRAFASMLLGKAVDRSINEAENYALKLYRRSHICHEGGMLRIVGREIKEFHHTQRDGSPSPEYGALVACRLKGGR